MKHISLTLMSLCLLIVHCNMPAADPGPASRASSSSLSPSPAKVAPPAEAARPPAAMVPESLDPEDAGKSEAEYYADHPAAAAAAAPLFGLPQPPAEMIAAWHSERDAKKAAESAGMPAAYVPPVLKPMSDKERKVFNNKLKTAVLMNEPEEAQAALEAGADPNIFGMFKFSLLHDAARDGFVEIVKLLLAARANPNAKNDSGCTPMHRAIGKNQAEVVQALAEAGADVNCRSKSRRTPLHEAISQKQIPAQLEMFKLRVDDLSWRQLWGTAINKNDKALASRLFDSGRDINVPFDHGMNPLHLASLVANIAIVQLLLSRKANPNARVIGVQYNQWTPYLLTMRSGLDKKKADPVAALLLANGADRLLLSPSMELAQKDALHKVFAHSLADRPTQFCALMDNAPLSADELAPVNFEKTLGLEKGSGLTRLVILGKNDEIEKMIAERRISQHHTMKKDKAGRNPLLWAAACANVGALSMFMAQGKSLPLSLPRPAPTTFKEKASAAADNIAKKFGRSKPISFNQFFRDREGNTMLALAARRNDEIMVNAIYGGNAPVRRGIISLIARNRIAKNGRAIPDAVSNHIAEFVHGARYVARPVPVVGLLESPKAAGSAAAAAAAAPVESKEGKEELVKKD